MMFSHRCASVTRSLLHIATNSEDILASNQKKASEEVQAESNPVGFVWMGERNRFNVMKRMLLTYNDRSLQLSSCNSLSHDSGLTWLWVEIISMDILNEGYFEMNKPSNVSDCYFALETFWERYLFCAESSSFREQLISSWKLLYGQALKRLLDTESKLIEIETMLPALHDNQTHTFGSLYRLIKLAGVGGYSFGMLHEYLRID
jgi:hypothetical protein